MASFDALLIKVGDQSYAMPLLQIQEIRGWTPVSALPDTDPACLGVLNLRGHVLPVFDARRILQKPNPEPRPQDVIVVADLDGKPVGLLVDGVSDIVKIDDNSVTAASADEVWSSGLVEGIANVGDQLVPLLALQRFVGERLAGERLPAERLPEAA